ncbi:MAG: hypothetical protein M3Z65_00740 [Chloroflexota bacterium]|nr:hypothetical protein [Chloroflexota bacterium]
MPDVFSVLGEARLLLLTVGLIGVEVVVVIAARHPSVLQGTARVAELSAFSVFATLATAASDPQSYFAKHGGTALTFPVLVLVVVFFWRIGVLERMPARLTRKIDRDAWEQARLRPMRWFAFGAMLALVGALALVTYKA